MKAQPQPTLDDIAEKTEDSPKKVDEKLYICEITIKEIIYDGDETTENTIAAPKITFKDGQKASMTITDDKGENSVVAEVVVNDDKNDGFSNIDVHVKEKGKTLTHSTFKFKLK